MCRCAGAGPPRAATSARYIVLTISADYIRSARYIVLTTSADYIRQIVVYYIYMQCASVANNSSPPSSASAPAARRARGRRGGAVPGLAARRRREAPGEAAAAAGRHLHRRVVVARAVVAGVEARRGAQGGVARGGEPARGHALREAPRRPAVRAVVPPGGVRAGPRAQPRGVVGPAAVPARRREREGAEAARAEAVGARRPARRAEARGVRTRAVAAGAALVAGVGRVAPRLVERRRGERAERVQRGCANTTSRDL